MVLDLELKQQGGELHMTDLLALLKILMLCLVKSLVGEKR